MEIVINAKSNDYLVTIAIGDTYLHSWQKYAYPTWKMYCEKHGLGLIVFTKDLIQKENPMWKKATWQKLLIGDHVKSSGTFVKSVCYLDTDILISPIAPNVFDYHKEDSFSVVSQTYNLPYPLHEVRRRLAFLRHKFYDHAYPLDSALFSSIEQIYKYHNLPPQPDEFCAGLIMFNITRFAELMKSWFFKYPRDVKSITDGGDQTHINYEVQNHGEVNWIDYKFQTLWVYEMAWKYPFLYNYGRNNDELIKKCVESSLFNNYFLHFAGSWYESDMWKIKDILIENETKDIFKNFALYLEIPVSGQPKGVIKP